MKPYFLLFMMITNAFALPCPNGSNSFNNGDTLEQVRQACGQPKSQNHYIKMINFQQRWDYYIPHDYDNNIANLVIFLTNDQISSINIIDNSNMGPTTCETTVSSFFYTPFLQSTCGQLMNTNLANTTVCGSPIKIGDTSDMVKEACGIPDATRTLQNNSVVVDELTYDGLYHQMTFENGKLASWQ